MSKNSSLLEFLLLCENLYVFALFRFPDVGANYNDAITNCKTHSGSLLKVEEIKFIDANFAKSKSTLPIFRIDAKKGT